MQSQIARITTFLRTLVRWSLYLALYLASIPVTLYALYQLKNLLEINLFPSSGWHAFANCTNRCLDASVQRAEADVTSRMVSGAERVWRALTTP